MNAPVCAELCREGYVLLVGTLTVVYAVIALAVLVHHRRSRMEGR